MPLTRLVQLLIPAAILAATVLDVLEAPVVALSNSRPLTLIDLTLVLDDPLTLMVAVRGEGMRGYLKVAES